MQWEYLVVGAGSAGCALAHELGKSGRAVLIIEAGGPDRSPYIKIPGGVIRAGAAHDWGYRSQPDLSRNGATESWTRGRVLGGSSSINGTMYVRGGASDFDRWNIPGWSGDEVMRIFRDMECSDQPGSLRGHAGLLHVRTVKRPHALTRAFMDSAHAAGYPLNEDYNGASQEGIALAQLSQRRGLRCSAADAFLKPLLGNGNIELLLGALVERVGIENGCATTVTFLHRGSRRRESARHVILCAGTINSPKLLMLSGIGRPEELEPHGIAVRACSPHVGRFLREHPLINLTYGARVPSNNLTGGLTQKLRIAWQYAVHAAGPLANPFEAVGFLKSSARVSGPDMQLHFLPVGYSRNSAGALQALNRPAVTVLLNISYPKSTGQIRLASNDPGTAPLIECCLLADEADVETLADGVGTVRRIVRSQPLADMIVQELRPGPDVSDRASLRNYIRNHTEIAFHPVGTCRMGTDSKAVVTPELRVNGVENLWVADASVMPNLISGNTNAVSMMIGMKLGRYLRSTHAGTTSRH